MNSPFGFWICLFPSTAAKRWSAWVLVIPTLAGCFSGQKPTYPVQGKLVWEDGNPAKELSGGMVIFQCDAEEMSAKAPIDQEGGFILGTYTQSDAGDCRSEVREHGNNRAGGADRTQAERHCAQSVARGADEEKESLRSKVDSIDRRD
jgi:hypothetical protein